ncbi:MAG: chromate resistance protein ChrB domain-containing protein, partial [Vicinamibacteria bacterium]
VATLVKQLEDRASDKGPRALSASAEKAAPQTYRGRLWVTRPRPGVDRMACAWLIQRFIDPRARFGFAADRDSAPADAIPYDMFGVRFSHRGEGCTFETLSAIFDLREPSVARLAAIVHDLDLKDERFGAPESATVGTVIEGLLLAHADDDALLSQGIALFEALYRAFERSERLSGPRPRKPPASRRGKSKR